MSYKKTTASDAFNQTVTVLLLCCISVSQLLH